MGKTLPKIFTKKHFFHALGPGFVEDFSASSSSWVPRFLVSDRNLQNGIGCFFPKKISQDLKKNKALKKKQKTHCECSLTRMDWYWRFTYITSLSAIQIQYYIYHKKKCIYDPALRFPNPPPHPPPM